MFYRSIKSEFFLFEFRKDLIRFILDYMIVVENVRKYYHHPLVQLSGLLTESTGSTINVCNQFNGVKSAWPIFKKRFNLLIHLTCSINHIKLWIDGTDVGEDSIQLDIEFVPLPNKRLVRLIYVTCLDDNGELFDDGRFQSPNNEINSMQNAFQRLSIGLLMCQCFYAQTLQSENCFQIELDDNNWPIVHQFTIKNYNHQQLWLLSGEELWKLTANQLMNSKLTEVNYKFVSFNSYARYFPKSGHQWIPSEQVKGFVSLGGNDLALLSTHCLYTWPETIEQIPDRLKDSRTIFVEHFMNDSDHRYN